MPRYFVTIPDAGSVGVYAPNELRAAAEAVLSLIGESADGLGPYVCTVTRYDETWTVNASVAISAECVSHQNSEETP